MGTTPSSSNAIQELSTLSYAQLDLGLLFEGKESGTFINGFTQPCAFTPEPDLDYEFHETARDVLLWFMNEPEPLYVWGPTGCGKTSLLKQVATRLNYPVFEVNAHNRMEFDELCGHVTVKNHNMAYEYGPLALAMRYGGLFILNEIDVADPAVLCGLNTILDGSPLCIPENDSELIKPHPYFRFAATGNSNGSAEESGMYQGTLQQNMAFLDRFTFLYADYPDSDMEKRLLQKCTPQLPQYAREKMVDIANEVRGQFKAQQMEVTFSTRALLRWAKLTVRFLPLAKQGISPILYALQRTLGDRASLPTQEALKGLIDRIFGPYLSNLNAQSATACESLQKAADWNYLNETLNNLYKFQGIKGSSMVEYFDATPPTIHLEKDTPSGGKWWECKAFFDRIVLRYGANGTSGAETVISLEQCRNKSTIWEMMMRCKEKIDKGYKLVLSCTSVSEYREI